MTGPTEDDFGSAEIVFRSKSIETFDSLLVDQNHQHITRRIEVKVEKEQTWKIESFNHMLLK